VLKIFDGLQPLIVLLSITTGRLKMFFFYANRKQNSRDGTDLAISNQSRNNRMEMTHSDAAQNNRATK
jgi:hypothetical protein